MAWSNDTGWLRQVREAVLPNELLRWSQDDSGFRSFFDSVDLRGLPVPDVLTRLSDGAIYFNDLPAMVRAHEARPTRHVLLTVSSGNWGAFSNALPNRTVDWGDWAAAMAQAGCSVERVVRYLDDPKVLGVVATNHSAIRHPKIIYLPVGVPLNTPIEKHLRAGDGTKTAELMINSSDWQHRAAINQAVIANFGGSLRNSYGLSIGRYYQELLASKFLLCPSGFGWDTYRIWEALCLGTIPIVERSPGWDSLLDDLPALIVGGFEQVTPQLLSWAHPEIMAQRSRFNFSKLTRQYWVDRITARLS